MFRKVILPVDQTYIDHATRALQGAFDQTLPRGEWRCSAGAQSTLTHGNHRRKSAAL